MGEPRFAALRKAIADRESFEFRYNENPKCPHCGSDVSIVHNDLYRLFEDGKHEIECPSCECDFTVSSEATYAFHTDEQEAMDDDEPATEATR